MNAPISDKTDTESNPLWGDDWAQLRNQWMLDPAITFLNHGSFGATPRCVIEAQNQWRLQMEARPIEFLDRQLPDLIDEALEPVAQLLNTSIQRLAFVPNATTAINSVVKSIDFAPGDELVIARHGYPAIINTLERTALRAGAKVVFVPFELPITSSSQIVDAWSAAMTDHTRLVIVDHITSPSAIVCPVRDIVAACKRDDRMIMVDAAHAPGMVPIDLESLGADCWTGNLHKWTCAPKGAAVLWMRDEHQERIHPAVTSHPRGATARILFKWTGTDDPTPYLSVPAALKFLGALGWERIRSHNRALVTLGRRRIAEVCQTEPIVSDDSGLLGSMAVIEMPPKLGIRSHEEAIALQARLYKEFAIEVPAMTVDGRHFLRISAQVYNAPVHYDRLASALQQLIHSRR